MACQQSPQLCVHLSSGNATHIRSLLHVLMGAVDVEDMEFNSVMEAIIHTLSVVLLQTQSIPVPYVTE